MICQLGVLHNCVLEQYSINLVNTIKQTIVVFQHIKHDSPGTLHTPGILSSKMITKEK